MLPYVLLSVVAFGVTVALSVARLRLKRGRVQVQRRLHEERTRAAPPSPTADLFRSLGVPAPGEHHRLPLDAIDLAPLGGLGDVGAQALDPTGTVDAGGAATLDEMLSALDLPDRFRIYPDAPAGCRSFTTIMVPAVTRAVLDEYLDKGALSTLWTDASNAVVRLGRATMMLRMSEIADAKTGRPGTLLEFEANSGFGDRTPSAELTRQVRGPLGTELVHVPHPQAPALFGHNPPAQIQHDSGDTQTSEHRVPTRQLAGVPEVRALPPARDRDPLAPE